MELIERFSQSSKHTCQFVTFKGLIDLINGCGTPNVNRNRRFFFWLFLKDRLNTRGMLRRRNMFLDSYTCENCILQREETQYHLFFKCSFARQCWNKIGLSPPRSSSPEVATARLKSQIQNAFSMEIIILMIWSIWKCRNGWIFQNIPPTIQDCFRIFSTELRHLEHRVKNNIALDIHSWLQLFPP